MKTAQRKTRGKKRDGKLMSKPFQAKLQNNKTESVKFYAGLVFLI